jgi:hypothetical protein
VAKSIALRGRSGSVAAAALIGIGLSALIQQVTGFDSGSIVLIALGVGFFLAYFNQLDHASNLLIPAGVLSGLGLGALLTSNNLTPGYMHGAIISAGLAFGFGAIYLLGDARRQRWALYPAAGLGLIAWFSFVSQAPWLKDTFGALTHVAWPLVLVGAGLWLIERSKHRADTPG